jgi:hypothetical protein
MTEITYEDFLDRVKNPVTKCLMHDDATNAANLIELWRKTAVKMSYWAEFKDFDAMRHEYEHAYMLEKAIINKLSTQQAR